jgi:hypothetical protein
MPGYGVNRPLLNIYVAADTGTRAAIGSKRPLLDCRECARLELEDAALGHLEVYAQDARRARLLLSDPTGKAAVGRLVPENGATGNREIYVQPGRVWLHARPRRLAEQQFRQLLDDMLALASASDTALRDSAP